MQAKPIAYEFSNPGQEDDTNDKLLFNSLVHSN